MRFVEDGDGHWYLIPVALCGEFWKELENGEDDYFASFCNKFDKYRVDHPSNYVVEIVS